jgi:hypothetical protein
MSATVANAAYLWIKRQVEKPFMVPVGTIRRRGKSGSSVISDFLTLRRTIFLCASCEHKMPYRWLRRWEYRVIPGLHSAGTRCDNCQLDNCATNIYVPEDQGYWQEHLAVQRHEARTAAQRVQLQAGQRLTR